jgi:hypothetical protein
VQVWHVTLCNFCVDGCNHTGCLLLLLLLLLLLPPGQSG